MADHAIHRYFYAAETANSGLFARNFHLSGVLISTPNEIWDHVNNVVQKQCEQRGMLVRSDNIQITNISRLD